MKPNDQREIAEIFKLGVDELLSYLPILSNYRNLCAHEDILYNHKTATMIPNSNYHKMLNIPIVDGEYTEGKNDLFALILILKKMLLLRK